MHDIFQTNAFKSSNSFETMEQLKVLKSFCYITKHKEKLLLLIFSFLKVEYSVWNSDLRDIMTMVIMQILVELYFLKSSGHHLYQQINFSIWCDNKPWEVYIKNNRNKSFGHTSIINIIDFVGFSFFWHIFALIIYHRLFHRWFTLTFA